ncbi:hypothetical protein AUJ14_00745 [Candidatus Micrarchaeota archaeon CG1_02_55_22]|nr:MAG: hypothetical protein AUJ14_00745 [Candidatus Micrarchaeota archaeon CG1_02_55_22]
MPIMHVDLDAFYASIEQRDHAELRGKPVIVCMFTRGGGSGAVATASYEARKLGVHSGMALFQAKSKAPDAIYLPADLAKYKRVSDEIMSFLRSLTKSFEQVSIDEAFMEVDDAPATAQKIRQWMEKHGLSCSIGVGKNKLVSKIAANRVKPNGLTIVPPGGEKDFVASLDVGEIPGLGNKAEEKLAEMKVEKVSDLARLPLARLVEEFGNSRGNYYYQASQGEDYSPVTERGAKAQSGRIATLAENTRDKSLLLAELERLAVSAAEKAGQPFRRASVYLVFSNKAYKGKQKTLEKSTTDPKEAMPTISSLLDVLLNENTANVRRVGVSFSGFGETKPTRPSPKTDKHKKALPQKSLSDY